MTLNELALDTFARYDALPVSMRDVLGRCYVRTVSLLSLVNASFVDAREEARSRIEAFRRDVERAERGIDPTPR